MAYTLNSGQPKPYVYQEYPRRLYKWAEKPCSVNSDEARAAKEAEGWSIDQQFAPPPDTTALVVMADRGILLPGELSMDEQHVLAEEIQRKRRGRPPKVSA